MKISLNWLNDYIDLDGISVDELVDKLTIIGLEIDEVIDQAKLFENFIVGEVREKQKHPNADKLSLCRVFDGENELSVICGAPNVAAGQKIPLAKIGAVVPESGFEIKKVKLRGELSEGMICSEKELNISDNHDGIMVLDPGLAPGEKLSDALKFNDVVFDIAVTPNRSDALSHVGVARDLAAAFGREYHLPKVKFEESGGDVNEFARIEIENTADCPRYSALIVRNVKIGESPAWLKQKLTNVGSRPINNIVDVTNFVLHELGQPLHAFDLDYLAGNKIIVKSAEEKSKFITLDSKERTMSSDDLMICDGEKEVAIAGVMGGENSEVTEQTVNVLIESAFFRPSAVRKTSKVLGLSTDASYRFERGTNPEGTVFAAERAAQLMAELAGGEICEGAIDVYPVPLSSRKVDLRYSRIEKILGYTVPAETVKTILTKLELPIIAEAEDILTIDVPPFRHDIEREIDLIEEVARIYGYNKIPENAKISISLDDKVDQSAYKNDLRNVLVSLGFSETITNSLLNKRTADEFGKPVKILNPQSQEMAYLRTSLLPGALQTVSRNIKVKETDLALFEIGRVFNRTTEGAVNEFSDFQEDENLVIVLTGDVESAEWYSKSREADEYDLKGILQSILDKLNLTRPLKLSTGENDSELFSHALSLTSKSEHIGLGGKVGKNILKDFDIKQSVFAFELNVEKLASIKTGEKKFEELLKYPKVIRDFAFILDKTIKYDELIKFSKRKSSNLLKNIKLFDIFESDSLGKGKKSVAFELEYFDTARTLEESEVDEDFWRLIEAIKREFNAELRGKD